MVRSCERIIRRGDELCIYNCGVHGAHTGPKIKDVVRKHRTAVGLLIQRRDGFASLDAGDQPGYVLTKTFPWPGGDLHLNLGATHGVARAALCDEAGRPFPGLEASEPIRGDHPDATVRWPDASLLPKAGQAVKLRLSPERARLFAWWLPP